MSLGVDGLRLALELLNLLVVAAVGAYAWFTARTKANRDSIAEIERTAQEQQRQLDVLTNQIDNAPTHHDLGRLYDRLNSVSETMSQLSGQLQGVHRQLSMVNEYLLNRDGREGDRR